MTSLVDTNILVYRFDPRDRDKQRIATELLRSGIEHESICIAHQAIVEFVQAVSRPLQRGGPGLLSRADALLEAEAMLDQFEVLWPEEGIVRLAVRGAATYQLSWFDAHMWAYAEFHGFTDLVTEDFASGQRIGAVRIRNPFVPD